MNKKSGISMIALIVTMIVALILMTTIALKINVASGREELSVFANNVSVIEEYIASCNILKEELPFEADISIDEVKQLINTEYINLFETELINNGDNLTTSFKKINLTDIGIKKQFTGYGEQGANDIYIYSEVTGMVYYLLGVEYDGNVYFSVNDKITNIVK